MIGDDWLNSSVRDFLAADVIGRLHFSSCLGVCPVGVLLVLLWAAYRYFSDIVCDTITGDGDNSFLT